MKLGLAALTLVLAAGAAVAQPILIPLESQPKEQSRPAPVASAPPVAPPTAPPSQPEIGIARGGDTEHPEEAYQPPQK